MSSEFLENIDQDVHGSDVSLCMKASGDAFLYAGGDTNSFYHLPPNEIGHRNAKNIADALYAWIEHTKKISGSNEN